MILSLIPREELADTPDRFMVGLRDVILHGTTHFALAPPEHSGLVDAAAQSDSHMVAGLRCRRARATIYAIRLLSRATAATLIVGFQPQHFRQISARRCGGFCTR